jgi:preprotein translocase subunit SecD
VVDDYALAIRIPASEKTEQQTAFQNAYTTFGLFAETGALEIKKGDALVDERLEYEVDEIIKEFSVYTKYEVAYIQVKFTDVGKEMIKSYKDSGSEDKLTILLGDQNIMEINATEHITTKNVVRYPIAMETEVGYVETMVILLNSVLENGSFDIEFNSVSNSEVRSYSALDGENTLLLIYIALAIILVGLMVCSVWKMGGFGVSNVYSTVSYLIVTAICYAFISGGVFEITFGSILVFVVGLVLTNVLNLHIYGAIRSEAALGKTIESSVKGGYRKTIMTVVDVYAVLTLGAVALLIGVAGVNTFALQALICIVTAAFCNLLWTRVINVMLLSASKDKYKYFGLVREDDDDE